MTQKAVITSSGLQMVDLSEAEEQEIIEKETEWQNGLTERQKNDIRFMREPLLAEADIAIFKLEDASGDTTAWRTYRQQLRDMTSQSDLENPVWPTKPQ